MQVREHKWPLDAICVVSLSGTFGESRDRAGLREIVCNQV
jgi:hypothetical protein